MLFFWFFIFIIILIIYSQFEHWATNGYEPVYDNEKWDKLRDGNNCYAYAFDNIKLRNKKPQPGNENPEIYECSSLLKAISKDLIDYKNPSKTYQLLKGTFSDPCPNGYHKIYLVLSDSDYHFYRLDDDGKWSHKPGNFTVSRLDSKNNEITDPSKADHNYGEDLNYNRSCGFLCVPKIDEAF